MKVSKVILLVPVIFLCFSCGRKVSDRVSVWKAQNVFPVSVFPVSKMVDIDLSHEYDFDFSRMKIVIMVNGSTIVFKGNYQQLCNQKVKLPKPLSGDKYLICVRIIDPWKKEMYTWSSDVTNHLSKRQPNQIKLLYTGTEGENAESITLQVTQIT